MPLVDVFDDFSSCKRPESQSGVSFQIVPRVAQRGRQEPDVARLLDRVIEVQSVRVRSCEDS